MARERPRLRTADNGARVGRRSGRRPGDPRVDDVGGDMRFVKLAPLAALGLLSACSVGDSPTQIAAELQPYTAGAAAAVEAPPAVECPAQAPGAFVPPSHDDDVPIADLLSSSTSALLLCTYDRSITGPAGSTTTTFTFRSGKQIPTAVVATTVKSINDLPPLQESDDPVVCGMLGGPLFTLVAIDADGLQQLLQIDAACGVIGLIAIEGVVRS